MKILKYQLTDKKVRQEVELPKGARILSVRWRWMGHVDMWAEVNPDSPAEIRTIDLIETGVAMPPIHHYERHRYIGTTDATGYSLHAFEVVRLDPAIVNS